MASGQQMSHAGHWLCSYRDQGSCPTLLCGPEEVASPLWAPFHVCEDRFVTVPKAGLGPVDTLCRPLLVQLMAFE